jgi:hypothetical protein
MAKTKHSPNDKNLPAEPLQTEEDIIQLTKADEKLNQVLQVIEDLIQKMDRLDKKAKIRMIEEAIQHLENRLVKLH